MFFLGEKTREDKCAPPPGISKLAQASVYGGLNNPRTKQIYKPNDKTKTKTKNRAFSFFIDHSEGQL